MSLMNTGENDRQDAEITPERRRRCAGWGIGLKLAVAVWSLAGWPGAVHGSETDQYTVPTGREFADLRLYFSNEFHAALSNVITRVNRRIQGSLHNGRETTETRRLQSRDLLASELQHEFPLAAIQIEALNLTVTGSAMRARYPGLVVGYQPPLSIYYHPLLVIDLTKLPRLARSVTIMIDGVYMGVDKIDHFVHVGYTYYTEYQRTIRQGADQAEATRRAIGLASRPESPVAENGLLGLLTTGIRSNADLASNYMGLKFYLNLTEPVRLHGEVRPPLLVREGSIWRLNDHVRPNSDFFAAFVSQHWNEALNPSTYGPGIPPLIAEGLRQRRDALIGWYRDRHGRLLDRDGFLRIATDLTTYYGEDYGHVGDVNEIVSIANSCFDRPTSRPAAHVAGARSAAPHTQVDIASRRYGTGEAASDGATDRPADKRDAFGRTSLWWAASDGQMQRVAELIKSGADVNAADVDGETPLHAAARWGHAAIVKRLLAAGADPRARALYGSTPLHRACRELRDQAVQALLDHGVEADLRDDFGCTPLHDAVARTDVRITSMLLAAGADPDAADFQGITPRARAKRSGNEALSRLLARGAIKR